MVSIMLELLNIRITFLCRTTRQNKRVDNPIVLRIIYRNERRDVFTGLMCISKVGEELGAESTVVLHLNNVAMCFLYASCEVFC